VQEVSRAASQILAALEQIGKGTSSQATATQQASTATAQILKGAQLGKERAAAAVERGGAVRKAIEENKKSVEAMVDGLQTALNAGRKSQELMVELDQVARRIDKIVDAIVNVSIQTNMLAVNGSVEAARAGEFGKGFAVVSTDIRNLAGESAENADRIKDLVKAVQDQVVTVRGDLREIVDAEVAEVEKARALTSGLTTVAKDTESVVAGNEAIDRASVEIFAAVSQVGRALEQISAGAQQANRAAQEATSAATQQADGAKELARAIEEIASLADELQS
jgi:methyl-accepting chemotaxis protein